MPALARCCFIVNRRNCFTSNKHCSKAENSKGEVSSSSSSSPSLFFCFGSFHLGRHDEMTQMMNIFFPTFHTINLRFKLFGSDEFFMEKRFVFISACRLVCSIHQNHNNNDNNNVNIEKVSDENQMLNVNVTWSFKKSKRLLVCLDSSCWNSI